MCPLNISMAEFQSTLSVRRATDLTVTSRRSNRFQSTLSVRRATRKRGTGTDEQQISIHALRKESDVSVPSAANAAPDFNPRSP